MSEQLDWNRTSPGQPVLYEVFVRNHSQEGTFKKVEEDLPRIRSMGVDVVWLMPHYPIGIEARKGTLGSPYSIMDYKACNESLGTIEDFRSLASGVHEHGMKLMIDIVFNHTSRDSSFAKQHPEWFKRDVLGLPTSPWADVADLNYEHEEQWEAMIDALKFWSSQGVDGFRCDVASMVPLAFWLRARDEVDKDRKMIWLAESVDTAFLSALRKSGLNALCDAELLQAFDFTYDYDLWNLWCSVVAGVEPLSRYLAMLQFQETYLPANAGKMRFVENHDQMRIMKRAHSREQALAWTAFAAFNSGAFLIHAGQEEGLREATLLFEKNPIPWDRYPYQNFLAKLAGLKKRVDISKGHFVLIADAPLLMAAWIAPHSQEPSPSGKLCLPKPGGGLLGLFNVDPSGHVPSSIDVPLDDGVYTNLISDPEVEDVESVEVVQEKITIPIRTAIVLHFEDELLPIRPMYSSLMEFKAAQAVF